MALVRFNGLDAALETLSSETGPRVFLIAGEPFLADQALDTLTKSLLPEENREFALDRLDGTAIPMGDIIEQATTFSFLTPKKIIVVKNPPLFANTSAGKGISYSPRDMELLEQLIEKGIPDTHCLILISYSLDKRKKIFKFIQKQGFVIDCTIPQGSRKADLDEQRDLLKSVSLPLLRASGKTLNANAFSALVDQTGFNPEIFMGNIEKLSAYTGNRKTISATDIHAVINKDKKDPIYDFTNAVLDRNPKKALEVLSSLISDGFHPLQLLKSLENQIRKLLLIKGYTTALKQGKKLNQPLGSFNFNQFKQVLLPQIISYDQYLKKKDTRIENLLSSYGLDKKKQKPANKKKAVSTDLLLAPNPKSPYPVFQNFLKSENYSLNELIQAMGDLSDLDYGLKSSSREAVIGLENFILTLCKTQRRH